jgi:hypothetical protein
MATLFTQGTQSFCRDNEVFWFLDIILSYQTAQFKAANEFQVWKFLKNKTGNGGKVICEDGNDNILIKQSIPFTDCKKQEFKFWYKNDTIYLPSEH